MAQEIDQYLKEQFCNGLKVGESGSKLPLHTHFEEIRKLLEQIFQSSWLAETDGDSSNREKVREKLYYLNNVLTECQMLSWRDQLTVCKIRRKLNDTTVELREWVQKGTTAAQPNGEVSSSYERQVTQWSTRVVDASRVHGFDNEVTLLEKLVLRQESDDQFKAIGIVGKAGVGKTTLCQVIFNKPEVQKYFLPRIWVCMSRKPNEDNDTRVAIVKRMLDGLGVDEEIINKVHKDHSLKGLLYALHQQLYRKRYLIVLDDASDNDAGDTRAFYGKLDSLLTRDGEWDCLAYGLPKGYGGVVIVTSRNEELAKNMVGEENLLRLLPRSDPESFWKIFKDAVEKGTDKDSTRLPFKPSNVEDLKKQILQKCDGFPITAKMLGEIMHDQVKQLQDQAAPNDTQQAA
ncbi:hypothetical protein ACB098_05G194700 [Castanea mollissima]|uniref:NB-ARC domain-containing protein n=1 Tax=Castanea mollissima TaxID=60419 RepID=A0A8J4RMF6_9ROSI|nr:hypothetical protein CMV_008567 [Castanea mollissima]